MTIKVLFVCTGNICRSPSAEGVFLHTIKTAGLDTLVEIDSAGTHGYHVGSPPDLRSQAAALNRGYDISSQRARQINSDDFEKFDLILAMDLENMSVLQQCCPAEFQPKLRLFLSFASKTDLSEVPDPYYGGRSGFESVLDLIEDASQGLLAFIRTKDRIKSRPTQ